MLASGKYQYLKDLNSHLTPMFQEYGYEFYDFSSVSTAGSTDLEAIDGFHGSESVYMNILIKMIEKGSALSSLCDINTLRNAAKHKVNRYTVYEVN